MALGHEKLDVYRLAISYVACVAAILSRLGKRGYSVQEESVGYRIDPDFDPDFDSDFDPDEMKSQPDTALNADKPRE